MVGFRQRVKLIIPEENNTMFLEFTGKEIETYNDEFKREQTNFPVKTLGKYITKNKEYPKGFEGILGVMSTRLLTKLAMYPDLVGLKFKITRIGDGLATDYTVEEIKGK